MRAVQGRVEGAVTGSDFTIETRGSDAPVQICLLGSFRLFARGQRIVLRSGTKQEELLACIALSDRYGLARDRLLARLWPNSEERLAMQSLNTLIYTMHRLLGEYISGEPPVIGVSGMYRLNRDAGIESDVAYFDALTRKIGSRALEQTNDALCATLDAYSRAIDVYVGDLCIGANDVAIVVERERLRARYQAVLRELADYNLKRQEYAACLERVDQLLKTDPCLEDAHRRAIRCYVRLGLRAQALHQFRVCEQVLRAEYDAAPEPATVALFEQVRMDPANV